jgi:predicted amidophosphoribosyltransferase
MGFLNDPICGLAILSALLVVCLIAAFLRLAIPPAEPRRCPWCRERVKRLASVCPHCARPIGGPGQPTAGGWG